MKLKYFDKFFLLLLSLIPFIPEFYVIDIQANQFLYLSVTQPIIFLYLIFIRKPFEIIQKVQNHISIIFSILFLITCLISISYAQFKTPAFIEFFWYSTLFLTLFNTSILVSLDNNYRLVIYTLTTLLLVESIYTIRIFIENFNFENGLNRIRELQGFSANQNINAFSICIKIPLLFYIIIKTKNIFKKALFSIFLFLSVFSLLVVSSRGSILALLIILMLLLFLDYFIKFKISIRNKLLIFIIFLFSFSFQNILYISAKSRDTSSYERMSQLIDASSNYRLESYKVTLNSFLENPFTGVGIGNWQLYQIKKTSDKIIEYQAPKHVHNDFLQILADIGILGFVFFVLIYLSPILFFKKFNLNKVNLLRLMLCFSLIIFLIDSNLNFPRVRPYSQMNIIYILSIFIFINNKESKFQLFNLSKTYYLLFIILIPIFYSNLRIYLSSKEQLDLMRDFNFNQSDLVLNTEKIEKFNDTYPDLNNTNIPLKNLKALYYIQENKFDKARELIKGARKQHDFWGISDYQTSLIFYEEKNIDSAYYYAKEAYKKLPKNRAHVTQLQRTLFLKQNLKEMEDLFISSLILDNEAIWQNYLVSLSDLKLRSNIGFSENEKSWVKEGIKKFPKNKEILRSYRIIIDGADKIIIANEYDNNAKKSFSENNFLEAIGLWKKSLDLLPDEKAYYYNISLSFSRLNENSKARDFLSIYRKSKNFIDNGEWEYYFATTYLNEDLNTACSYFLKSAKKGNENSILNLNKIGCVLNY